MTDYRSVLERDLRRVGPAEFTLHDVARRRDRKQKNRRTAAIVVALALVVLVFGGWVRALTLDRRAPADGNGTPAPVPSSAVRFESPFYGYSIDLPEDWSVTPASIPWAWGEPRRADVITANGPTFSFDISIASIAIPGGVTGEEWRQQEEQRFTDVKAGTCRQDPTRDTIDLNGIPGRVLVACDGDLFVTLLVETRGYVIATSGAVTDHLQLFRSTIDTIAFRPRNVPPVPESASDWRGIWPQTTREEAKVAQERADAAGSESAWQVDWNQDGIVAKRFLVEYLGWDGARGSAGNYVPGDAEQAWEAEVVEWYFIRCADGTNPLYPDHPTMGDCAPTIDETHFEQVVVRAEQLIRPGRSGIWLITGWDEARTYEQAVPRTEGEARALMRAFLDARLAGNGAEPLVECCGRGWKVELNMYETSGGSPYVRYEFDLMDPSILVRDPSNPVWPTGEFLFRVTLFAEDGTTVEEWPYAVGPRSGPWALYDEQKVFGCCYFQIKESAP